MQEVPCNRHREWSCVMLQTHYFTAHPRLNYYAIVPKGPAEWWKEPHDRDQKFPAPK